MNNLLEVHELSKRYENFSLKNISFSIPGGSIMGFIGENGAGKSTTMKCILGIVNDWSGSIRLLGEDAHAADSGLLQDVGIVMDNCFFHDSLTPTDVGRILGGVYQNWDKALYKAYLEKFSLPPKQTVKGFSRGMKMKLSLATALAHSPKLLILDEATAGLDPVVRDEILEEFQDFICDEEHAILISSHITSDLEKVADYITYIHDGEVLFSRAKDDIMESYGCVPCTATQADEIDSGDYLKIRRGSYGCRVLVENRTEFARKYPHLPLERTTLEEIMLLIGKGEEK